MKYKIVSERSEYRYGMMELVIMIGCPNNIRVGIITRHPYINKAILKEQRTVAYLKAIKLYEETYGYQKQGIAKPGG
jgi:hypothetical protein